MMASDFQRGLRRLNPRLRIFCGDNPKRAASIYYVAADGEVVDVCGIDKNIVPEYTTYDEVGHIVKGGYRRALKILIIKGLVDRRRVGLVFGVYFDCPPQPAWKKEDRIGKALDRLHGQTKVHADDVLEAAALIRKEK